MARKFSRKKFQVMQANGMGDFVRRNGKGQAHTAAIRENAYRDCKAKAQAVASPYGLASIIVGACSWLVAPLLLGPAAIVLGALAIAQGDGRGLWGILLGFAGPVLAVVIGSALFLFVLGSGAFFGL